MGVVEREVLDAGRLSQHEDPDENAKPRSGGQRHPQKRGAAGRTRAGTGSPRTSPARADTSQVTSPGSEPCQGECRIRGMTGQTGAQTNPNGYYLPSHGQTATQRGQ